ncbi:hypothetical protein F7725_012455 [Dissostichus mawsoni]|uniref:BHLH domain-containing protein n=1 Tax=Dissostichus mawsoni TaxID=36200 RepID=A0A7J5YNI2_DISMA|nr:hypothetical protein F7725_012455 [Dissostichus mawsoni]
MAAIGMVQMLIEAAEYLERREREAEHGYASMPPFISSGRGKLEKEKQKQEKHKSTHNEMEKNRRANLRLCLERLKSFVPLGKDANRHTTLSLLMKAREHIKRLEESDRRAQHTMDQLQRERRHLRRRLQQLGVERTRMDSTGSTQSDKSDSDQVEHQQRERLGGRAGESAQQLQRRGLLQRLPAAPAGHSGDRHAAGLQPIGAKPRLLLPLSQSRPRMPHHSLNAI